MKWSGGEGGGEWRGGEVKGGRREGGMKCPVSVV